MKILIFTDKLSSSPSKDEVDTLVETIQVKESLSRLNHEVVVSTFSLNLEEDERIIKENSPDFIFNLVETLNSNSSLHLAPLVFEQNKIRYSGGSSFSLFMTGDKVLSKQFLKTNRIKTADFYSYDSPSVSRKLINRKVISKPISDESSRGINDDSIHIFKSKEEIKDFINKNPDFFIEEYIEGREFNISALKIGSDVVVLPVAEMKFIDFPDDKPKILNYNSKWDEQSFEYKHSQRSFDKSDNNEPLYEQLVKITKKCYSNLGNKGYLRVDFRVDNSNNPYVLEINTNPCISDDAGFTAAAAVYGMNYDTMIDCIIREK